MCARGGMPRAAAALHSGRINFNLATGTGGPLPAPATPDWPTRQGLPTTDKEARRPNKREGGPRSRGALEDSELGAVFNLRLGRGTARRTDTSNTAAGAPNRKGSVHGVCALLRHWVSKDVDVSFI